MKNVPKDLRRNKEHYMDLTAGQAIESTVSYIYNPKTFCNHIQNKLGDYVKAHINITWEEEDLKVEIQNFEFVFTTYFRNLKECVGKDFVAYYVINESVKRYRKHVNQMFFRQPSAYI